MADAVFLPEILGVVRALFTVLFSDYETIKSGFSMSSKNIFTSYIYTGIYKIFITILK